MAGRRDKRSRFGRALELLLYTMALAVPLLYFARQYPPVEAWLGRIELRSPIVVNGGPAEDESSAGAPPAAKVPQPQRVYRCVNDGEVVLSDTPCGNVVESREIGPGDVNILPSEAFTGHAASPENVDCESLKRRLDELDARRTRSGNDGDGSALERDATWQKGRAAGCW